MRDATHDPSEERFDLLERQIEAINKFPDQNPNPVLRLDLHGHLLYANASSAPVAEALGLRVGEATPVAVAQDLLAAAAAYPPGSIEVAAGGRTYQLLAVAVPSLEVVNVYGTDITASKVVERFPDRNPNPVLRMDADGRLIYANPASRPIVASLEVALGEMLPDELRRRLQHAVAHPHFDDPIELPASGHIYRLEPVPIPEFGFVNIYGTDVTAARTVTKFPDQNPNPVLRVSRDGVLVYANPASADVVTGMAGEVGQELPTDTREAILAIAAADEAGRLEVQGGGRVFELLVVPVFEFGFINIYGTDVTAARAIEAAHRENERLLLNILPASIADRLRRGEGIIADGFDEITVLFADVVDFTRLSSTLVPRDVVLLLNEMFAAFDQLADRYGVEKIKTVGDAYMVAGGLLSDGAATASHVADMGLHMLQAVRELAPSPLGPIQIRIGMHAGPAAAGVIGVKKFIYDVWGDSVNMASRMETTGVPGRIQVAEATYARLRDAFEFEPRGEIEVKGKGRIPTWLLVARRGP